MNLVYSAYPLHRDPHYFTDELSRAFPPFVRCRVEEHVYINNARDEWFGCHLLWMDIYDKMFVFIWVWMAILIATTLISVFGLILWVIPPFNRLFLLIHTNSKYAQKLRDKIVKKYSFTDLYVLHLMKRHRSEAEFMKVMSGLVHLEDSSDTVMECKPKKSKVSFQDEVTSNGNYFLQVPPSLENRNCCMDSTFQVPPGLASNDVRNRRFDSSTPNSKCDVDLYFQRGSMII